MTGFVAVDRAAALEALIRQALSEDIGPGDWTTEWTVPPDARGRVVVVAKESQVVSGLAAAVGTFRAVDGGLRIEARVREGSQVRTADVLLEVEGRMRSLLTAERTVLNFLARLGGIATLTRSFVDAVDGTAARIVDTRKTTPGWRSLEKEAVRAGGGFNHRMGLYDMVLIKDNHIAAAGSIEAAINAIRRANDLDLPVEVEVTDLDHLRAALRLGVGRILLDNMSLEMLAEAVRLTHDLGENRPDLEASGNVTLETARAVAETGVDMISVGALTHSATATDLSLQVIE
jgi:nicotinate-nucleotide pyrophosphorylase (carboxylating)